jgi:hypothetical protein
MPQQFLSVHTGTTAEKRSANQYSRCRNGFASVDGQAIVEGLCLHYDWLWKLSTGLTPDSYAPLLVSLLTPDIRFVRSLSLNGSFVLSR